MKIIGLLTFCGKNVFRKFRDISQDSRRFLKTQVAILSQSYYIVDVSKLLFQGTIFAVSAVHITSLKVEGLVGEKKERICNEGYQHFTVSKISTQTQMFKNTDREIKTNLTKHLLQIDENYAFALY